MSYVLKTKLTNNNVTDFIESIENDEKKQDCYKILEIMENISGFEGQMWGKNIVGFGTYSYKYASGHSGEWMRTGFAPRAGGLSLYIMLGYEFGNMQNLLSKLGKFKAGKSCLNIKKLSDIDLKVLSEIIVLGLQDMQKRYPE